ncbi:MAG: 8-oxo-dGTP diphosphatase [Candidatus Aenigmatarchaeota archaeon]
MIKNPDGDIKMVTKATLCYVVKDGKVLLIKKKRGIGAGKFNGPGGRIEEGEDVISSAVREVKEELGITPMNVELIGLNKFTINRSPFMDVYVLKASDFIGEPRETDEAIPHWFDVSALPFDNMWKDDPFWMPLMLEGKRFMGKFDFTSMFEELVYHKIEEIQ